MNKSSILFLDPNHYPDVKLTRILLINGLLNLMNKKALSDITIKELADASQVARRTFYRLYDDKEDILKDYIRLLIQGYLNTLSPQKDYTVYERLVLCFKWCQQHALVFEMMDNKFMIHTMLTDYDFLTEIHADRFLSRNILSVFEIEGHLEKYYDQYNLIGFWHTMTSWIKNGMKETPEEMASLCIRVMSI